MTAMNNLGHKIFVGIQNVISSVKPTLKNSKFYTEGVLTPEEYVEAGDFLTQKCPTWKWFSAAEGHYEPKLPKTKQYLKTTVKSSMRADEYLDKNQTKETVIVEGDWLEADLLNREEKKDKKEEKKSNTLDLEDDDETPSNKKKESEPIDLEATPKKEEQKKDEKKIPEDWENYEIEDSAKVEDKIESQTKIRIYDVVITYDFFYCVPRMWLTGSSEGGSPLTEKEMTQDIMPEYRNQTVTIEVNPRTGINSISVHPCRHSMLLKKMIENFERAGKKLEVYMSILIFLKFLHSVVPTIQYDFTMDLDF